MSDSDGSHALLAGQHGETKAELNIKEVLLRKREGILAQLKETDAAISQLRGEFRQKLGELEAPRQPAEEALHHVEALLRIEGVQFDGSQSDNKEPVGRVAVTGTALALDAAYRLLERAHRSMHYKDIARQLREQHVLIAGKDPAATLLSGMARDARFRRSRKRGTYRLSGLSKNRTKVKRG